MQYAGIGRRAVAATIDGAVLFVIGYAVALPFGGAGGGGFALSGVPALVVMTLWFGYLVGTEARLGATLGKLLVGLRVVRTDGSAIDWTAAAVRNALRIVDALFFYLVGAVLAWNSSQRQRLGDRVAGTIVVRTGAAVATHPALLIAAVALALPGCDTGDAAEAGAEAAALAVPLSTLVFARDVANDEPVGVADRFDDGPEPVYAFLEFRGLEPTDRLSGAWYRGNDLVLEQSHTMAEVLGNQLPDEGVLWWSLRFRDGKPPGFYRLEVHLNGEPVQTGRFAVAPRNAGPALLNTFFTGGQIGAEAGPEYPLAAATHYPEGVDRIFAVFDHFGLRHDHRWGWRLSREGVTLDGGEDLPWEGAADGTFALALRPGAPGGLYDLDVLLEGERQGSWSFAIGEATAPGHGLLEADDFDDPGTGWPVGEGSAARAEYRDGRYVFTIMEPENPMLAGTVHRYGDVVAEVDVTTLGGPEHNAAGIVVRRQDDANLHAFLISAAGRHAALRFENGRTVWDWRWTTPASDAILAGHETNRLRVLAHGSTLRFYANGHLLGVVPTATWDEGRVGLMASTTNEPGAEIAFDRWRVWAVADADDDEAR